jgi:hypothetical protein
VELGGDLGGHALQRGFESAEADGAPGAGDVGDEVDAEVGGHGIGVAKNSHHEGGRGRCKTRDVLALRIT